MYKEQCLLFISLFHYFLISSDFIVLYLLIYRALEPIYMYTLYSVVGGYS